MSEMEETFNNMVKSYDLFKVGKPYLESLIQTLKDGSPVLFHSVDVLRYKFQAPMHFKDLIKISKCKVVGMILIEDGWNYALLNEDYDKDYSWNNTVLFYAPQAEVDSSDSKNPITSVFRNYDFLSKNGYYGLDQIKLTKKKDKEVLKKVTPLLLSRYDDLFLSVNDLADTLMMQGAWLKEKGSDFTFPEFEIKATYTWTFNGIGYNSVYSLKQKNYDGDSYSDGDGSSAYNNFKTLKKAKQFVFVVYILPTLIKNGLIED